MSARSGLCACVGYRAVAVVYKHTESARDSASRRPRPRPPSLPRRAPSRHVPPQCTMQRRARSWPQQQRDLISSLRAKVVELSGTVQAQEEALSVCHVSGAALDTHARCVMNLGGAPLTPGAPRGIRGPCTARAWQPGDRTVRIARDCAASGGGGGCARTGGGCVAHPGIGEAMPHLVCFMRRHCRFRAQDVSTRMRSLQAMMSQRPERAPVVTVRDDMPLRAALDAAQR